MTGYTYEIRRYPLALSSVATPGSYFVPPFDEGFLLERGTIDRATLDIPNALERQLARLAATWKHVGPFRLKVQWLRTPRGPHAKALRNLSVDSLPPA